MATTPRDQIIVGGGEMGDRMRAFDWERTPLGPPERWPQSLRSAISILLPSKAQIVLFWGPDLIAFYNDAYRPVFGAKHPGALGQPARECWREVWDVLRPLFEGVMRSGEAFWASDHPFYLERHGYSEETYFDVSYDPVRDESGGVGGVFCIVSETTGRVLGERRLRTLRELDVDASASSETDVCTRAASVLAQNQADVPFGLFLVVDDVTGVATLVDTVAVARNTVVVPDRLDLRSALPAAAIVGEAIRTGKSAETAPGVFVTTVSPTASPERALVLPLIAGTRATGVLVTGVSRHLAFTGHYRDFFELVAGRVSTGIAAVRAYAEERRRAQALAELDRAKTAFFSNVSHEFRTPLTLLLGPLEELLDAPATALAPEQRGRVDVAHRNALRLHKLVNSLLDFSRIEAGRVRASYEPIEVGGFTAELASAFRSLVEGAGIRFVVDCVGGAEAFVDRDMWEKIVFNLLSNAVKHTFAGEIRVTVRRVDARIELAVTDTGTGIAPDELPRIFERFHRVPNPRARTHEGTGIGLALVAELVKLHGGTITVTSELDRGSTFTVSIPTGSAHLRADRIDAAARASATSLGAAPYVEEARRWILDDVALASDPDALAPTATDVHEARVLLVDDNADMREYLRRLLGRHWTVTTVSDGRAALAAARAHPPDLVLSDVMMPGLDGFQLLRALRADPRTRTVPVILLSARAGEESRVEGLEAGADDYLVKPFSAREVVARVHAHLQMAAVRREFVARLEAEHTERLALLAREQAARAEADAANQAKDRFLAVLSHELRTPLNTIMGWVRMLQTGRLGDGERTRAIAIIERNVERQAQLVNDLLDVSRITAGKLELDRVAVDLVHIVREAIEALKREIDAKELELVVDLDVSAGEVLADPLRLQQVVVNLLTNAIKFTPERGRLAVTVARREEMACLTVTDSGEGIDPTVLPRIFDPFEQGDPTVRRRHEGLGLGLAIVQQLVELHGGTVRAESAGKGQGATFTVMLPVVAVRLPRREPRAEVELPVATDGPETRLDGLRVLVVDDQPDARDLVALVLEQRGAAVHTAGSVAEALDVLADASVDVLVSDIAMPGADGYELIAAVRANERQRRARRIRAVALTAYAGSAVRARAIAVGFDAHATKPSDPDQLVQLVARLRHPA